MGLLNYIEDEPSLFAGVLRDGYDWLPAPSPGEQRDDVVPRYSPSAPIEASAVGPSGRPRVVIPTNSLPVVEVTADQSPPAVSEETISPVGVAKALGIGAAKGTIGLFGLPGDAVNFGRHLLGYESNNGFLPSSEEIQKKIEEQTGAFYRPKGRAEEAAETLGGFMPGFLLGEGALVAASKGAKYLPNVASRVMRLVQAGQPSSTERFVTRVAAPGAVSEAAGQYYKGTDQEKYARMLGAFAGSSGAGLVSSSRAGFPSGVWGALYSNTLRGALQAKAAEAQDARRRRERETQ